MSKMTYDEVVKELRADEYTAIAERYSELIEEIVARRWSEIEKLYKESGLDATDENYEEILFLRSFEYRMSLMLICCLSEYWEQDLCNYLLKNVPSFEDECEITVMENALKAVFRIDLKAYPKIGEMRSLVNAIKHGKGRSMQKIKEELLGQDILCDSNLGFIDEHGNEKKFKQASFDEQALTSETINVKGKIIEYCEEIKCFWNDLYKAEKV